MAENPLPGPVRTKFPYGSETDLPPQDGESVINIPVTPEIRRETYKDQPRRRDAPGRDYFPSQADICDHWEEHPAPGSTLRSSRPLNRLRQGGEVALSGEVISATFMIPQIVRYGQAGKWEIERRRHRSALLDSFTYLSSEQCPWGHTIVSWMGEIVQARNSRPTSPDALPVAPTLTADAHQAQANEDTAGDEMYLTRSDMTAAAFFRRQQDERWRDIYVSFFLASPFPTSEFLLPVSPRGFRSAELSIVNSCARTLGYEATSEGVTTPRGRIPVGVFPEGIDVQNVTFLAFTALVDATYDELRRLYGERKLIVGCDPPDSLGGVDKKLQAFSHFLEQYPE
ncbi:hypothetical protein CDD83_10717 [Cordyceps sp. RAO-2017]|nr:hypothetical protein CDD83_10717 [Cordyceps sp. RAO-2017]